MPPIARFAAPPWKAIGEVAGVLAGVTAPVPEGVASAVVLLDE